MLRISGSSGNDTRRGTNGPDLILVLTGDDRLQGGNGFDKIDG